MGNRIAPARFLLFLLLLVVASGIATAAIGARHGILVGFDVAALVFLASCWPLLHFEADEMREAAERNDANRILLLGITLAVTAVVLVAVAAELTGSGKPAAARSR